MLPYTVFGLYSALLNICSPLLNICSPLRNICSALRNIKQIPVLWKYQQAMRQNNSSYHKQKTIGTWLST